MPQPKCTRRRNKLWYGPARSSQQERQSRELKSLPDIVKDFAPTGTLRAAINQGNTVLAQKGPNGEALGVTADLARELAKRLGVPIELVIFDAAGKVFEALKRGAWDIAFLAVEPVRAAEIDFTAPYVLIEGTYMVPKDSALKAIEDVDRAGVRIAVDKGSAYDLYLTRTIKNATLVRAPTDRGDRRCSSATSSRSRAASSSRW